MEIKTDIEIAQAHEMEKITEIAAKAGIDAEHLELYGKYKAKLDLTEIRKLPRRAKLVLVTAIGKVLIHVVARTPMVRSAAET